MKKTQGIVLAFAMILILSSLVLAEDKKEDTMGKGMMKDSMMGGPGMMGSLSEKGKGETMCCHRMMKDNDKMMEMHQMMGPMMMGKSMVATSDGGVIVLVGNKLMKYDKELNLVKEVEIKMDMEGMKKMMKEGKCCDDMGMKGEDKK